jgi:3-dehydroquinate dehydratase-2
MLVTILSGPNLSLLGDRQPEIYGTTTLYDHIERARRRAKEHNLDLDHAQFDDEGALVSAVHGARGHADALIINAGALTHYSWSLHDALGAFSGPVIELHLSNPAARESHRHISVIAGVSNGVIAGFSGFGYELAIDAVAHLLKEH